MRVNENAVLDVINKSVKNLVDDEVKEIVSNAKERLEKQIPNIVSGVTLSIMKNVSMRTNGSELTITVRMDK